MDRDQALAKIKKCMALAKSANEHEAAAALRQAQALMREHRLSDTDVELLDVSAHKTRARSPAINRWDAALARCVADAFACDYFSLTSTQLVGFTFRNVRDVVFVGIGAAAQVAAYAYDVLSRQCTAARLAHIRKQPGSCKPITKTARGDKFALGWVYGVWQMVERFAGQPGERLLIERYIAEKHPGLQTVKPKDKSVGRNVRDADLEAGFGAGKAAQLDRGLGAAPESPRLTTN